jgi:homoserine dehydrogenase
VAARPVPAARLDELTAGEGILNGTTDHMLTAMSSGGMDYASALKQAQDVGLAEADPSADVEGLDALRKLVLSVNLAFGVSVREEDIPHLGISALRPEDMEAFRARGLVCKLFTRAERHAGGLAAFVMPTLFPPEALQVHTNVSLYARRFGRQSFSGAGAGPRPSGLSTGSSVLGDCLDIMDGCGAFYHVEESRPCPIDNSGVVSRFYYRTDKGGGVSKPMSVQDAFAWIARTQETDPGAFFARLACPE